MAEIHLTAWDVRYDEPGRPGEHTARHIDVLHQQLHRETGALRRGSVRPDPGTKGAMEIAALLSSPAIVGGAVAVLREWLSSRDRRVRLSFHTENGQLKELEISGETIDNPTMRAAVEAALGHGTTAATPEDDRPAGTDA